VEEREIERESVCVSLPGGERETERERPFLGRVWASTTSWKKPKIIIIATKYWNLSEL